MRAVLTYHSIDTSGSAISIDEATLQRHVDFLAASRVRVAPLDELVSAEDDADVVALTFDDGFENFATAAWPRLRAAGLPATVFVVTDRVATDNEWDGRPERGIPSLPLMAWETLGRLVEEGLDVGSHTRTHRRLTSVCDVELDAEFVESQECIRRELGVTPRSVAYPYGDHDARVRAAAARVYASAWTTELGTLPHVVDAHQLPRLDAYYVREPSRMESFGSRGFSAYIARRALLRRVKARLGPAVIRGSSS